tara:strand:+ start:2250 stop:2573 length:324 start_codon:yes stop_codon:yes gene_type:complete
MPSATFGFHYNPISSSIFKSKFKPSTNPGNDSSTDLLSKTNTNTADINSISTVDKPQRTEKEIKKYRKKLDQEDKRFFEDRFYEVRARAEKWERERKEEKKRKEMEE